MKGQLSQSKLGFEVINFQLKKEVDNYTEIEETFYCFELKCEALPRIGFCKQRVYTPFLRSSSSLIIPDLENWLCFSKNPSLRNRMKTELDLEIELNSFEEKSLKEIFSAIQADPNLSLKAYLAFWDQERNDLIAQSNQLLKRAEALKLHMIDITVTTYGDPSILPPEEPKGINFRDGLENAIAQLTQIEGESWAKRQTEISGFNVATLYEAWKTVQAEAPDWVQNYPLDAVDPRTWTLPGDSEIYGSEGYTRYLVRNDGTIVASRYHVPEGSPKIAKIDAMGIPWV